MKKHHCIIHRSNQKHMKGPTPSLASSEYVPKVW